MCVLDSFANSLLPSFPRPEDLEPWTHETPCWAWLEAPSESPAGHPSVVRGLWSMVWP